MSIAAVSTLLAVLLVVFLVGKRCYEPREVPEDSSAISDDIKRPERRSSKIIVDGQQIELEVIA